MLSFHQVVSGNNSLQRVTPGSVPAPQNELAEYAMSTQRWFGISHIRSVGIQPFYLLAAVG